MSIHSREKEELKLLHQPWDTLYVRCGEVIGWIQQLFPSEAGYKINSARAFNRRSRHIHDYKASLPLPALRSFGRRWATAFIFIRGERWLSRPLAL